jgi:hypothetical protein
MKSIDKLQQIHFNALNVNLGLMKALVCRLPKAGRSIAKFSLWGAKGDGAVPRFFLPVLRVLTQTLALFVSGVPFFREIKSLRRVDQPGFLATSFLTIIFFFRIPNFNLLVK